MSFKPLALVTILILVSIQLSAEWKNLEPGLDLGTFKIRDSDKGLQANINILRIDPDFFKFRLLNASAPGNGTMLSVKQWCLNNGLVAAINASMYRTDYRTSVSYMRTKNHINNPYLSKDKSILAFDSQEPGIPEIRIIDRECEEFSGLKERYATFVQSIRMISCKGRNVWRQQLQKWSIAAIGTDKSGNILFIHSREPNSTHDFINFLLLLPLNINRAMYAEGGPEAQMYILSSGGEFEFAGVSENYPSAIGFGVESLPIPNVIGIARK